MDSSNTAQFIEQTVSVKPGSPWLQTNGKPTPEEHLKTLTPHWDQATWGQYLKWYEEIDGTRAESIVPPKLYDQICEAQEESIFIYAQSNADDQLKNRIRQHIELLTPQQQKIIDFIFWQGRSERYIANRLGISCVAVHQIKKRALKSLESIIQGVSSSRIMRGENSPLTKGAMDDKKILRLAEGDIPKAS